MTTTSRTTRALSRRARTLFHTSNTKALVLPTDSRDIVYLLLSIPGGTAADRAGHGEVASMLAAMLDQGTTRRGKDDIHDFLETRGASFAAVAETQSLEISLACLKHNLPELLKLIRELLEVPAFPNRELLILKKRRLADIAEATQDPNAVARGSITRLLFPQDHPYFEYESHTLSSSVRGLTRSALQREHRHHLGGAGVCAVLAGDVGRVEERLFKEFLQRLALPGVTESMSLPNPRSFTKTIHQHREIPGKTSTVLTVGQALPVNRMNPDYYALQTAVAILGSPGFTGRLMKEVREKQGLTYGIYSYFLGARRAVPGYFLTWGTFAPSLLNRGREETLKVIRAWVEEGVSKEELLARKRELIGKFQVSLSTAKGFASVLQTLLKDDFDQSFLDAYPEIISGLTLSQVNEALRTHLRPDRFAIVEAGTLPK